MPLRHAAALLLLASANADAAPVNADCGLLRARLAAHGIVVERGAPVDEHAVGSGRPPTCSAATREVLSGFLVAADRTPDLGRRATRVVIDPVTSGAPVRDVEVHAATGTVLVRASSAALRDPSILVHELVHARAHGARPASGPASLVMAAVEEGVADYVAAVALGEPLLGATDGREPRHLGSPPEVGVSEWAYLAVPGAPFAVHRFGADLARALWRVAPGDRSVAAALVVGMAALAPSPSTAPRAALTALLRSTPSPGREALDAAIARWIPRELGPRQGETSP